jgi:hypothetical protein
MTEREQERAAIEFAEGSMWEDFPWRIAFNEDCCYSTPCRHCHSHRIEVSTRRDGSTYETAHWICPRVVIAQNESGYNSTGVCLDCILEAADAIARGEHIGKE